MIGKAKWFTYRVLGWGIMPRTWQGWVYVGAFVALAILAAALPVPDGIKAWIIGGLAGVLVLDSLHIMSRMSADQDERERYHQLIIERNCSFSAVATLVAALGYQVYQHRATTDGNLPVDPWVLGALGFMVATKIASTLFVRYRH